MGNIYANAACTIAATAAKDSRGGLFHERSAKLLGPRRADFDKQGSWPEDMHTELCLTGSYVYDVHHLAQVCIERAPLNQRAWVSQERQLSRRLLHFTGTQLFWECNESQACEAYPNGLPLWVRSFWRYDATSLKKRVRNLMRSEEALAGGSAPTCVAQSLDDKTYWAWLTFRDQYSAAALTYRTDKLVAIQGIVNWIRIVRDSQFVAGLWLSHINEELCWTEAYSRTEPHHSSTPKVWIAPTWSWACSDAEIHRSMLFKFHYKHANTRREAAVVDPDVEAQISGQPESVLLKVRCRPLLAKVTSLTIELFNSRGKLLNRIVSHGGEFPAIQFHKDGGGWVFSAAPEDAYMIVLQRCLHRDHFETSDGIERSGSEERGGLASDVDDEFDEDTETTSFYRESDCIEALVVRAVDSATDRFERVGLCRLFGSRAVGKIMESHCLAEEKVITLV